MHAPRFFCWLAIAAFAISASLSIAQDSLDELERLIEETPPPAPPVRTTDPPSPDDRSTAPVAPKDYVDPFDEVPEKAPVFKPEPHQPGYLGVMVDAGVETAGGGILITDVRPDSPAAMIKLAPGDEIMSINSRVTRQLEDMASALNRTSPGDKVVMEIRRHGRTSFFEVTLADAPERLLDADEPDEVTTRKGFVVPDTETTVLPGPAVHSGPLVLGIRVAPEYSRRDPLLGFSYSRGVIVEDVVQGSPADEYGLPRGAELLAINGYRIGHSEQVRSLVQTSNPHEPLEVSFRIGGRTYRQLIPLTSAAAARMPSGLAKADTPADIRLRVPTEPTPARVELEVPPLPEGFDTAPTEAAKPPLRPELDPVPTKESKLSRLEAELAAIKRRAKLLEEQIEEFRDTEKSDE